MIYLLLIPFLVMTVWGFAKGPFLNPKAWNLKTRRPAPIFFVSAFSFSFGLVGVVRILATVVSHL